MKPYYYVYCPSQGQPTVKHDTLEIAQGEAERLAAKHPGSAFEILRCVGISQCSKASTSWTDGQEPPKNPRWRMLEEGELIADGDEFSLGYKWMPSQCAGQKYTTEIYQPHRRPL